MAAARVSDLPNAVGTLVHQVPIDDLLPGDSPRLLKEDPDHVRLLADIDAELPPITVDRRTGRVIDGAHRLSAARLRGQSTIRVRYFDGTEDEAFVLGVWSNITHGLPLSKADRETAVIRIAVSQPAWSDRAIAAATGLSAKTVKRLRQRSSAEVLQLNTRVGRDGRTRPIDAAANRRRVAEAVMAHPGASLREIARIAGVSPATVRDVRRRITAGEPSVGGRDAIPPAPTVLNGLATNPSAADRSPAARRAQPRPPTVEELRAHPALRSPDGEALLQWLAEAGRSLDDADTVLATVPPHCAYILARIARSVADEYNRFGDRVDDPAG
ncbi:ParB N-terminal domain-containing protein [Dactylosporangium sp. NPDC048998]|uniref:ParB N-terminal domain-containing protein n=1 Tax=Dactylosporangium sp. NPDC048998 TaxID=3363976 RepID=UPI00371B18DA